MTEHKKDKQETTKKNWTIEDESSWESFPASDPPAWTTGVAQDSLPKPSPPPKPTGRSKMKKGSRKPDGG